MRTVKFFHCADIHLDAPFREYGKGSYGDTRRRDIRDAFLNILKRVKTEKADFLLISGDLYEHGSVCKSTMEWLYMVLSEVGVPIVIIPGNHDPYILNSWYKNWEWPLNVSVLSPDNPSLTLENFDVNIYGIGFSNFKEGKPDLSTVLPPKENFFNILMFHGTLDMDFADNYYKPVTSKELESLGYDYYALGHFHNIRDDYPLKNAYNPGSPEPLGFDETGVHGAFIVTANKAQNTTSLNVEKFDTAIRVYHDEDLNITGCKTLEEVKMRILGRLESLNRDRDITRINLKGRTELSLEADMLTSLFSEDWLYLKINDDTQKSFDIESLEKNLSLKGAFVREMNARIQTVTNALKENPDNPELKKEEEILNLALNYGLEALQNGRIEWLGE
ncbi:MAG: DNA repair exonuclease [Clostridiaceae bacterium]|mgnify:CR=1 FL=1|nr:DNA repair exonuclease [Clostridiaceae bacterium]